MDLNVQKKLHTSLRSITMAPKKLQAGSKYEHFDKDGDGIVTDEEFALEREMMRAENEDAKEDQIRKMAWFALW